MSTRIPLVHIGGSVGAALLGALCAAQVPRADDALADIAGRRLRIVATARTEGELDPCT